MTSHDPLNLLTVSSSFKGSFQGLRIWAQPPLHTSVLPCPTSNLLPPLNMCSPWPYCSRLWVCHMQIHTFALPSSCISPHPPPHLQMHTHLLIWGSKGPPGAFYYLLPISTPTVRYTSLLSDPESQTCSCQGVPFQGTTRFCLWLASSAYLWVAPKSLSHQMLKNK